jgi:hypothetical protein
LAAVLKSPSEIRYTFESSAEQYGLAAEMANRATKLVMRVAEKLGFIIMEVSV